jgi:hypothetical protein
MTFDELCNHYGVMNKMLNSEEHLFTCISGYDGLYWINQKGDVMATRKGYFIK